ncbi:MAG TPA: DUF2071 domain-containing protein [Polyangiaceae bacterium]|nr:DUF2071 domain-containing protein [Polyangiaceae bacterium]
MHSAFQRTNHRPWPVPERAWTWRQSWHDLLFAHWPIPARELRAFVPEPLRVQEFEGTSYVGIVPFRMSGVMRRPFPDLPWVSAFPELNVRLYVEHGGKAGVWFLSLDATNPLAVWAARRFFYLPYYRSTMSLREMPDGDIEYRAARAGAAFRGNYRPTSAPYLAQPGTLEHWLTERYCLYALAPGGRLLRNDVHHVPWPLQRASAEITTNTFPEYHRLPVEGPPPLLHFARRIDVVVWSAETVSGNSSAGSSL